MNRQQAERVRSGDTVIFEGKPLAVLRVITTITTMRLRLAEAGMIPYEACSFPPFILGEAAERQGAAPAKASITFEGWHELVDGTFARVIRVQPKGYSARVLRVVAWAETAAGMAAYDREILNVAVPEDVRTKLDEVMQVPGMLAWIDMGERAAARELEGK